MSKKPPMMTWRKDSAYVADEKPGWTISVARGSSRKRYALHGHNGPECLMFGTLIRAKRHAETLR